VSLEYRTAVLRTDYLVVGAGAIGMGFVDQLIEGSDADVIMLDRRHAAGGHWLDSYPFVRLHQPSVNYGVNSIPLGQDRIEPDGRDAGFYERASGPEICAYFDGVMRDRLLASGRVRFYPMCEYVGDRRFRSRLTGEETEVEVRRSVVDATYMASEIPAMHPPTFDVTDGARCIPVGRLTQVSEPPAGYVIVGGGKTSMDAVCWLLDQGTPPDAITWVRPRDSWILNRAYFQPGIGVVRTFDGVVSELEATAESGSVEEIFDGLEAESVMLRTDPTERPGMLRGATASVGEVDQLRRVEQVVRLGKVRRIGTDEITLEHGTWPTSPGHLHVHCAASGLSDGPPRAIFADDTITLQAISRVSLSLSAGLTGVVEASGRPTDEKNRLCRPNPWPHTPFDWLRHLLTGIRTELAWAEAPDVVAWVDASRLNLVRDLATAEDQTTVAALQARFLTAVFPALESLEALASQATPGERARMVEPAEA
jgi:hypothetical protein